jgi:hypothetical protein
VYSLYVLRLVLYVFQIALKKRGDIFIPSAVKNNVVIDRSVSMGTSASETEHMEGGVHSGARYYLLYIPKYHGGKRIFRKNKNAPLEWDRFNHGRRVTPPSVRANPEPWR